MSETANSFGCYAVELYLNGERTEIIIDDNVLVYGDTKEIACSSSSNNDVWVQLLEKAWAKANGGYDKIVFGLVSEVLRSITGAPTFTYDHDDINQDEIFKLLKKATSSQHTTLCSLDSDTYLGIDKEYISNFSYNVIRTYKVSTTKGNVKLVKIRNPWGNFEWKGDWSDKSSLWTSRVKEDVDYEPTTNGVFYMSLEDYHQTFKSTIVCKIHNNYTYSMAEVKQDIGDNTILKFQVSEDCKAYFNCSQLAYRIVPKQYEYYPYNTKMMLARLDPTSDDYPLQYIDATVDEKDEVTLEADLVAGEYYLFLEIDWDESRPHDS